MWAPRHCLNGVSRELRWKQTTHIYVVHLVILHVLVQYDTIRKEASGERGVCVGRRSPGGGGEWPAEQWEADSVMRERPVEVQEQTPRGEPRVPCTVPLSSVTTTSIHHHCFDGAAIALCSSCAGRITILRAVVAGNLQQDALW